MLKMSKKRLLRCPNCVEKMIKTNYGTYRCQKCLKEVRFGEIIKGVVKYGRERQEKL